MGWSDSTRVIEAVVLTVLVTIILVQNFAPAVCSCLGLDESCQVRLETVTSAGILVAGSLFGAILGINWTPKYPSMINCIVIPVIVIISWIHPEIQSVCSDRFVCGAILGSIILGISIYAGAMLSAYYGMRIRRRVHM